MPAYLVVHVDIEQPEPYAEYMRHTPRIVAQYGGRFIARGATPETLEGPEETRRVVLLEFPTMDHARDFYHSADYQKAVQVRAGAGTSQIVAIDGYPAEEWQSVLAASRELSF